MIVNSCGEIHIKVVNIVALYLDFKLIFHEMLIHKDLRFTFSAETLHLLCVNIFFFQNQVKDLRRDPLVIN